MAAAMEMAPVLYEEQEVVAIKKGAEQALRRKHRVELDKVMETMKATMESAKVQDAIGGGVGAVAGGLALEGASIGFELSEPVDTVVSCLLGVGSIAGSMWLDESPAIAGGVKGLGYASLGRAAAGAVRWARR